MQKRNPKFWFDDEKETCKLLGLNHSPGSGNGAIYKEDGYDDNILMQSKATESGTISVKLEDLQKLEYHAEVDNKIPIFIGKFKPSNYMFIAVKPEYLEYVSDYFKGRFTKKKSEIMEIEREQPKTRKIIRGSFKNIEENKLSKDELTYLQKVKLKRTERENKMRWKSK